MQEQPPILHREDRVHRERDWGIEYYNNISIYVISNAIRTPFQGDFLVRVDPRAEALGCFLCALRAIGTHTRKSPNYRDGRPRPSIAEEQLHYWFALVLVVVLVLEDPR